MKMKITTLLFLILFPFALGAQTLTVTLSGANEVGGGDPDGAGIALVTFDGTQVTYTILVSGIDSPTMAHIHEGAAGVNGDIVVDLQTAFVGGTASGTVSADAATVAAILSNPSGHYVNVHNAAFPNGAVRGQFGFSSGSSTIYFPNSGNVSGLNETRFVTDLRLIGRGDEPVHATIEFFASSSEGRSGPTASDMITVQPGQQAVLDDVIAATLGITEQIGALRIVANGDLRADVRVLNDNRPIGQGTAGFYIAGMDGEDAATSGLIPLLSQASQTDRDAGLGFRTNIGFFNPGTQEVRLTLQVRSTDDGSVLGSTMISVKSLQHSQAAVFSHVDSLAGQAIQDFYLTWSSDAPVMVYAAVVDNKTGDVVYVQ